MKPLPKLPVIRRKRSKAGPTVTVATAHTPSGPISIISRQNPDDIVGKVAIRRKLQKISLPVTTKEIQCPPEDEHQFSARIMSSLES